MNSEVSSRVFFDIVVYEGKGLRRADLVASNPTILMSGRIIIELFDEIVPLTCENFRQLCIGEKKGKENTPLCYKGSIAHRVMRDSMIQFGDIFCGKGTKGESIYGDFFDGRYLVIF